MRNEVPVKAFAETRQKSRTGREFSWDRSVVSEVDVHRSLRRRNARRRVCARRPVGGILTSSLKSSLVFQAPARASSVEPSQVARLDSYSFSMLNLQGRRRLWRRLWEAVLNWFFGGVRVNPGWSLSSPVDRVQVVCALGQPDLRSAGLQASWTSGQPDFRPAGPQASRTSGQQTHKTGLRPGAPLQGHSSGRRRQLTDSATSAARISGNKREK
ncbi:hypothetical protein BIW11_11198 [Tropilaelaps mercedesae]|uniref:Uncharacterized protein n=1 Tax=Tropilaelaps mercedesae TaxID=418985 RepID=A0A1V9XC50_9ACAR|nr:hypothetical protein BIW11_11198 [Tropilaelaps mercedesae]